ncbi:MAG: hypothetical protein ACI4HJ_01195 [Ruminococcus sp.]
MKYEAPFIEIVRFQKENILLKASSDVTESPIDDGGAVTLPPSTDNPFKPPSRG